MSTTRLYTIFSSTEIDKLEEMLPKLDKAEISYEVETQEIESAISNGVTWFMININEADKEAAEDALNAPSEGVTLEEFIVEDEEEVAKGKKAGIPNLMRGSFWLVLGCGVSYYSFMATSDYGVITYVIILIGLGYMVKGLIQYFRK